MVAAPRRPPEIAWIRRLSGPAWALIPIASIIGVIFAIRFMSGHRDWIDLACVGGGPAVGSHCFGVGGARRAVVAVFLGGAVVRGGVGLEVDAAGQGAATLLSALSCVTLGWLLGGGHSAEWLKLGILAMCAADVWLVGSDLLQTPNATLTVAAPLPHSGSHLSSCRVSSSAACSSATATCSWPGCWERSWPGKGGVSGRWRC